MAKIINSRERPLLNSRERPLHSPSSSGSFEMADRSDLLPTFAKLACFELVAMTFHRVDPFVLYNRFGQLLYEWPEGYAPHWTEVYEVCEKLRNG